MGDYTEFLYYAFVVQAGVIGALVYYVRKYKSVAEEMCEALNAVADGTHEVYRDPDMPDTIQVTLKTTPSMGFVDYNNRKE